MEEDQEKPSEPAKVALDKPFIPPPPSLAPPPPPPPSPMENRPRITPPPPMPSGAGPVKLKTPGSSVEEDEAPPSGVVPFNTLVIAAVIDLVIVMGITIGIGFLLPVKLAYLVGVAYLLTRDSLPFLGGQSVGKKAMKIQVVTLDGKRLTGNWQPSLIRNAVLLIPFFGLVEIFMLLTREEKPERGFRLGDEWAKTKVIFEEKPVAEITEPPAEI